MLPTFYDKWGLKKNPYFFGPHHLKILAGSIMVSDGAMRSTPEEQTGLDLMQVETHFIFTNGT